MTKRVYRYFFDFLDGQTAWLNQMAAKGWRLVKCKQLTYEFESCTPDAYEYTVEFVADRSFSDSKNYRDFLENMGYKTFYKNINVGVAFGKVQWRPWAKGAGQIVTAPGGYFKELLIVEKQKDGKPFELHSDLTDKLSLYKRIRNACLWSIGIIAAMMMLFLSLAVGQMVCGFTTSAVWCALAIIPCALFGFFWLKLLRRISAKIKIWEDEAKTNEIEPVNRRKRILGLITAVVLFAIFGITMVGIAAGNSSYNSGSALMLVVKNGRSHWGASYRKLNGVRQRNVSLGKGEHTLTVDVVTTSGEINLSIKGEDGTVYYQGLALPTSTFGVIVDGKEKVVLRIDAKSHVGSYNIDWGE